MQRPGDRGHPPPSSAHDPATGALPAQEVTRIAVDGAYRVVTTGDARDVTAFAVLLTMGSTYRRLGIPGEDELIGARVHFCATCDGPFYRGKTSSSSAAATAPGRRACS